MKRNRISVREMTLFAMLAAMMLGAKLMMESLPNIHPIGMFTVLLTVVYRKKALIPLYLYVMLNGLLAGFSVWWVPYLYVWTVLWGVVMLLPKKLPAKAAMVIYPTICALHGFGFGLLYAPFQALVYHLRGEALWAWIIAGLHYDVYHGIGNFCMGLLIYPLSKLLLRLEPQYRR